MKKICTYLIVLLFAVVSIGCKRMPLSTLTQDYSLMVHIDTVGTYGQYNSDILSVGLYSVDNGKRVYESYISQRVGGDSTGLFYSADLSGLQCGVYRLLVYNFSAEYTHVTDEAVWNDIYAYTNIQSRVGDTPVITPPDHLFVGRDSTCSFPALAEGQHYTASIDTKTVIDSWELHVTGIKNLTSATKITVLVSGQVQQYYVGRGQRIEDRAVLGFTAGPKIVPLETKASVAKDTIIYKRFGSFGNLADGSRRLLTIYIEGPDGSTYTNQWDVSDQMIDSSPTHVITVDWDIKIKPREDGGFKPSAEEWEDEVEHISIG